MSFRDPEPEINRVDVFIPDPEKIFSEGDSTENYSKNMDRLFADDEKKCTETTKQPEKSTKSTSYFVCTTFWLKHPCTSVKVGAVLSRLAKDGQLYLLIYGENKIVLKTLQVDSLNLQLSEEELTITLNSKTEESILLKFADRPTFLQFTLVALLRSSNHKFFVLSDGSGDTPINVACDIRYNKIEHCINPKEETGMLLPTEQKRLKTRLCREKLEFHQIYKYLCGCRKGCHLLVKTETDSVCEIFVDKVRRVDQEPESKSNEEISQSEKEAAHNDDQNETLKVPIFDDSKNHTPSSPILNTPVQSSSPSVHLDSNSNAPPRSSVPPPNAPIHLINSSRESEDIRDVLHRIIGIELDRIEMRLNIKLENLQNDINSRIDRQTELIRQILETKD